MNELPARYEHLLCSYPAPGGVAHSFIQHSGRLWMPTIVLAELYEQICDDPSVTKVLLVDRTRDLAKLSGSYLDLGTETGMRLVLNEVFRSVSRCRHTKNTENSTGGFVYHVLNRIVGKMQLRYVEWNPLSAGLVDQAQLRPWGSLWSRTHGTVAIKAVLSHWPVERPANWTARVNGPLTTKESDRVLVSIERGRPYGKEKRVRETVKDSGLEQTVRRQGRPGKASESANEATSSLRGFYPADRFANKSIASRYPSRVPVSVPDWIPSSG